MGHLSRDDGIITVLLLRLKQQRLPRVNDLYQKVTNGGVLNDLDITFLNNVYNETKMCHAVCKNHHEYDDLFCRVTHFYHEIATTALANENRRLH